MATRNEQRESAVRKIAQHLLKTGLAETSLRQLAGAAGVSDRMLLYYFADKNEAVGAALEAVAGQMAGGLAGAIPEGEKLTPAEMVSRTAGLATGRAFKPFMALWIEVVAAAARGQAPYTQFAKIIAGGFLTWIESHLEVSPPSAREATAAMILAMVDGLALLDVCAPPGLAERAAARMTALRLPTPPPKAKRPRGS